MQHGAHAGSCEVVLQPLARAVQAGKGSDMMFGVAKALPVIRESFRLVPGDVVFTGTPKGVGPLKPGQKGTLTWGDKLRYSVLFH